MKKSRDHYKVDVDVWAGMLLWPLYEIGYLAADIDPDKADGATDFKITSEEHDLITKTTRVLDRYIRGRTTTNGFRPVEAIEILARHNIQFPARLIQAVEQVNFEADGHSAKQRIGEGKPKPPNKSGITKELKTVRRILLAIAVEKYRYDPDGRTSAVRNIVNDVQKVGLSVDEGTLLNHLRSALDELSASEEDQLQAFLGERRRTR